MHYKQLLVVLFILILISGCKNPLPEERNIRGSFNLLNQDSTTVIFPDQYKGNILVTGFIFTNCPDICPMTIHNMQRIQKNLEQLKINNVKFAAVSFDPLRDTPSVLKEQVKLREINTSDFVFLTGKKSTVDSLLDMMNIFAFADDTINTKSGEPVYFFVHTDRINLIDQQGKIRKEYSGSKINIEEIISDIKYLGE